MLLGGNIMKIKNFKLVNDEKLKIDSNVGLLPIFAFMNSIGLIKFLEENTPSFINGSGYDPFIIIVLAILNFIAGGEKVSDINKILEKNPNIQIQLGLKKIPENSVIYKRIQKISYDRAFTKLLKKFNKKLVKTFYLDKLDNFVIDYDATLQETRKEGAKKSYRRIIWIFSALMSCRRRAISL